MTAAGDPLARGVEDPPPGRTRYTTASSVWEVDADARTLARWPRHGERPPDEPPAVPYWSVGRPEPYTALAVRTRGGRPSSLRGVMASGVPFTSGRIETVEHNPPPGGTP